MDSMNILLTVSYDGTNYCGWQRQANGLTVQEVLENAVSRLTGTQTSVTGASRTDAGVHALGQRAVFKVHSLKIPLDKLPAVINSLLPEDVAVTAAETVHDGFDPRRHAKEKTYEYNIYNRRYPNPLLRNYSCHIPHSLNLTAMSAAASYFTGTYDFTAFCATGGSQKTTVRTVYECKTLEHDGIITVFVRGNAFLYNMVRIISGTILYAGLGKLPPESVKDIIESRDRTKAGKTMPPQGLVLKEILY